MFVSHRNCGLFRFIPFLRIQFNFVINGFVQTSLAIVLDLLLELVLLDIQKVFINFHLLTVDICKSKRRLLLCLHSQRWHKKESIL